MLGGVAGVAWVSMGFLAMLLWTWSGPDQPAGVATWAVVGAVVIGTALMLASASPQWWGARIAGAVIGFLLVGAVADRFGLLGAPGDPGVSWGDWAHFRAETAELVPWSSLVQTAAVVATVSELVLGVLLLIGWQWRWVGKLSAGLFAVYLVAMIPGMGAASILEFGVPVLIGGCLVASARGQHPLQAPQRVLVSTDPA